MDSARLILLDVFTRGRIFSVADMRDALHATFDFNMHRGVIRIQFSTPH